MKRITAEEARSLTRHSFDDNNLFTGLFDKIEEEAKQGHISIVYPTDGEHFSEEEMREIEGLGYEITWNGPCLWYEVSWYENR